MGILYAAGQPIDAVDKLSLEQLHLCAKLVQLGQIIRRGDDTKALASVTHR